ncbi:MAG: oligopeptide transporter, OPT family, partial [Planctomycetota bacterium]
MRELTVRALVLGAVLSALMCAANTYLGLRVGMTVCASIPAAVVSMAVLRGVLRTGTVRENNIVQTVASAGESLAAGVIFTIPALILVGYWGEADYVTTTFVALLGGTLGVLFMVPLRRALVEGGMEANKPQEQRELKYPEGVACAEVLKVGEEKGGGFRALVIGGAAGALHKGVAGLISGVKESFSTVIGIGYGTELGFDFAVAPFAVGMIVGPLIGFLVFLGGLAGFVAGVPLAQRLAPQVAGDVWGAWKNYVRVAGVGAMVVGGVWSLVRMRGAVLTALAALRRKEADGSGDLSSRVVLLVAIPVVIAVFALYWRVIGGFGGAVGATIAMVVAAFFFVAVSSYITGLVGSSNNPVSGMTICTLLFAAGVVILFGLSGLPAQVAMLIVAGVVCVAAATAGDISQDLKTGQIVGATPWKQQVGQLVGVVAASFVIAPVISTLHESYGIGTKELSAPQATLFKQLSEILVGKGDFPWVAFMLGAAFAVLLIVLDGVLRRRGAVLRLHVMPVAVGLYLPFSLGAAVFAGGLFALALRRIALKGRLVLAASGLIAGEALMGLGVGVLRIAGYKPPVVKALWWLGIV